MANSQLIETNTSPRNDIHELYLSGNNPAVPEFNPQDNLASTVWIEEESRNSLLSVMSGTSQNDSARIPFCGPVSDDFRAIDPNGLTIDDLKKVMNEMSASLYQKPLDIYESTQANMSWNANHSYEWIRSNMDWCREMSLKYGSNDLVSCVGAHEIGHGVTNKLDRTQGWKLTDWHHELCADFIAGAISFREHLNPDVAREFYMNDAICPCTSHPDGITRVGAFTVGYDWAKTHLGEYENIERVFNDFIRQTSARDFENAFIEPLEKIISNAPSHKGYENTFVNILGKFLG